MMNGADLGPNVFVAMQTIARKEGWTALYRGEHCHMLYYIVCKACHVWENRSSSCISLICVGFLLQGC